MPLFFEKVVDGYPHVGEGQLAGVLGVQADLLQIAAAVKPRCFGVDHQQRQPLVPVRPGAHGDDEQVTGLPVGDKGFRAIDDIVVAVAHRRGANPGQIAAGAGLGHRDAEHRLAGHHTGQPAALLCLGRQIDEVGQHNIVLQRERDRLSRRTGPLELLDQDRVVAKVVDSWSAELLRHREAQQPQFPGLGEQPSVPASGAFPVLVCR